MNPRTSSATRTLAASRSRRVRPVRVLGAAAVVSVRVALVAGGVLLVHELHSSRLQARAISRHAAQLDYARVAGHSDAVRYPVHGPFDQRLGYTELPRFSERLHARGFSQSELVLRMTREEIGSYLGLKLETVSRTFSKFVEDGIVEVKQRHVRILDTDALKRIVNQQSRQ